MLQLKKQPAVITDRDLRLSYIYEPGKSPRLYYPEYLQTMSSGQYRWHRIKSISRLLLWGLQNKQRLWGDDYEVIRCRAIELGTSLIVVPFLYLKLVKSMLDSIPAPFLSESVGQKNLNRLRGGLCWALTLLTLRQVSLSTLDQQYLFDRAMLYLELGMGKPDADQNALQCSAPDSLFMQPKSRTGSTVCGNLVVKEKIGTGSFGDIYLATSSANPRENYAVKFERASQKESRLLEEAKIYKKLAGNKGVPNFFAITTESGSNVLVMQLLGKSLEDLFQERGKKLSIKTCLMAGLQMLDRVELLHKNGFLHRDMKPDNFLIGRGDEQSVIYVIDLGLSKRYIRDGVHAPYRTGKDLTGTARYVSIGTHQGYEQSRRDDLESLAYVILYLMRGSLPWQNLKPTDKKAKYQAILEKKLATPVQLLCLNLPKGVAQFLIQSRKLKFEEEPDYRMFRNCLLKSLQEIGQKNDLQFDWLQEKTTAITSSIDKYFDHINQTLDKKAKQSQPSKMLQQTLQPTMQPPLQPKPKETARQQNVLPLSTKVGVQSAERKKPHSRERGTQKQSDKYPQPPVWKGPIISVIRK